MLFLSAVCLFVGAVCVVQLSDLAFDQSEMTKSIAFFLSQAIFTRDEKPNVSFITTSSRWIVLNNQKAAIGGNGNFKLRRFGNASLSELRIIFKVQDLKGELLTARTFPLPSGYRTIVCADPEWIDFIARLLKHRKGEVEQVMLANSICYWVLQPPESH